MGQDYVECEVLSYPRRVDFTVMFKPSLSDADSPDYYADTECENLQVSGKR
jgi:hypothetical protein